MTFADLKQSIITELNRDDLDDVVNDFVAERIRHYQRLFFYAAQVVGYVNTAVGTAIYASQATQEGDSVATEFVRIDFIRLNYQSVWQWISGPVPYETLLHADVNIPSVPSVPTSWAKRDGIFRLFPVPDAIYQLELTGLGKIPIPDNDDASNFWTEDAADLIRTSTVAQIYLRRVKNAQAYQAANTATEDAFDSLTLESVMKGTRGIIEMHW